jgi:CRISPR-associated protein Cas2
MRRFYIVSYDIQDDRRRSKIAKLLSGWGDRIQYSVFCCQLNPRERLRLEEGLKGLIKQNEDQAIFLDAGIVKGEHPEPEIVYIGKTWKPEPRIQII